MRKIEVKDFITIKEALYEPKRFNIIIGPQATGKSLLVKLDYFFSEVFKLIYTYDILFEIDFNFEKEVRKKFFKLFDKNIIKNYKFEIEFSLNDIKIKITNKEKTTFLFNEEFFKLRENIRKEFSDFKNKNSLENNPFLEIDFFNQVTKKNRALRNVIFIPAGRTYFATLSKSIFTLLAGDNKLDDLLLQFGSYYENVSKRFQDSNFLEDKVIKSKILTILKGDIKYSKEENSLGVIQNSIFTRLSFLSSGQQEVLPLISILVYNLRLKYNLTIEEPEAHLYPTSQKELIELIAYIYNKGSNISLTTHSPYIITTVNNLLLLDEKKDKINKDSSLYKKLDFKISSKDISAYTIENGILKDIYDKENNLIDAYSIDRVSEELSQEFDELLEL